MGRRRSCKNEINKGTWTKEEDETLFNYITLRGEGKWREVAQFSGLKRCAKSCRYRYLNYLKPGLKRGDISEDEQELIIKLHNQLGNRWALIAKRLPGRTDIEIKNYWKIYLSKKLNHQHKAKISEDSNIIFGSSSDHSTTSMIMTTSSSNIQTDQDDDEDENFDDFLLLDPFGNINDVKDLNSEIQETHDDEKEEKKKKKDDDDENVIIGRHGLKGAWSKKEDEILSNYVALHGEGQWNKVAQRTGLKRCGKSCRHRYLHYLKPGIKRGNISEDEEQMIIKLHSLHGNRWTLIAKKLPGRTDSEIKNHWHAYLSKKLDTAESKSSSSSSSSLLNHYDEHKSEEEEKDKHIEEINNCELYAPYQVHDFPTMPNSEILEEDYNNIITELSEFDHTTQDIINTPTNSFQIEYDHAFLDNFLFNFFQNDQINVGDVELICKTQKTDEDHNMFGSSLSLSSSSSSYIYNQCPAPDQDIMDFWTSSEFRFLDW